MNLNGVLNYLKMKTDKNKLRKVTLTYQEWLDAMRVPTPHRNKKKYNRKKKHKNKNHEDD